VDVGTNLAGAPAGLPSPSGEIPEICVLATLSHQPAEETESGLIEKKQRAVELLALVLSHPAGSQEAKDKAQRLLPELEAEFPPQMLAAARGAG
jgi:hypothetical protein